MADKTVRNLAHLQGSGSSNRVLNLLGVYQRHGKDPQYLAQPFFQDPLLNRTIILKHRLRREELELFTDGRQSSTKVIVPLDSSDLRLGGRSVLVNQQGYEAMMEAVFGSRWTAEDADRQLLDMIDEIPSLDPFLLREHLRRNGRQPARFFFDISEADAGRMFRFVQADIQKLIDVCYANSEQGVLSDGGYKQGARLVKKILSNAVDAETEPLRLTLRLERRDYEEGVFCWKGFLYYKWTLTDAMPKVNRVANAIASARPRGAMTLDTRAYLEKARQSLGRAILTICETAKTSLKIYDDAFGGLVDGKPQAFRDFLLSAPSMFTDLGERLGAVNHIVSFWNFRFPQSQLPVVAPEELMDIFSDFENSLAFPETNKPLLMAG